MENNNPNGLEIGLSYWFKYKHCEFIDKQGGGVITDSYEIKECSNETELEECARKFLIKKDCKGFAYNSELPRWMAEFFNEVSPKFQKV